MGQPPLLYGALGILVEVARQPAMVDAVEAQHDGPGMRCEVGRRRRGARGKRGADQLGRRQDRQGDAKGDAEPGEDTQHDRGGPD